MHDRNRQTDRQTELLLQYRALKSQDISARKKMIHSIAAVSGYYRHLICIATEPSASNRNVRPIYTQMIYRHRSTVVSNNIIVLSSLQPKLLDFRCLCTDAAFETVPGRSLLWIRAIIAPYAVEFQLDYRPSVVVPERMNFDATIIEPSLHCLQLIEEDYQRFITLTFGVRASYMTVTSLGY